MQSRRLGPFTVSALGLGCMGMSQSYGTFDDAESARVLLRAVDIGYTFFDTAALYGFGHNESLLGRTLKARRQDIVLASKCGLFKDAQGRRSVDGRPETLKRTCEEGLQRLQTEVIDLYYLHRKDPNVPIEDSVGALAELVREGKIRSIGLCEVSADTLRKAHRVHPVTALQSEYSLWTRNPESQVLPTCRELGIGFVAYCPLGRGFLAGAVRDPAQLGPEDLRRSMPRFQEGNLPANVTLLEEFAAVARAAGCTMAQLALAWLLGRGDDVIPIPGTKQMRYMEENAAAVDVVLPAEVCRQMEQLINPATVAGARYNAEFARTLDSEHEK